MNETGSRVAFLRRLVAAAAVLFIIVAGGVATAGSFQLLRYWLGSPAATAVLVVGGAIAAVIFWPAWFNLRQWAGVPQLDTSRRELLAAMATLPSTTDPVTLSECFVDVCGRLLPDRAIGLLLPEPRSERLSPAAIAGPRAGDLQSLTLPRRSALARALEREGRPLIVTRWVEGGDGSETPGESDIVFPLTVRGNLVGVLVVGRTAERCNLNREETRIVQELCNQAASALENAQLYGSLRSAFSEIELAQRELVALQRATMAAQSSLNLNEVLGNVCNGVLEGLDYHEAIVFLVDPATKAVIPASAAGRLLTPKLRRRAVTERSQPLRLDSSRPATRSLLRHEILISHKTAESILPYLVEVEVISRRELLRDRTVVSVPLVANGEVVGGMALLTQRRTLAERELDSLRGFAAQAASAIVNARLYEDLRDAYNDIRVAQDELVRSERLRTVGELASGVAHDFNNILLAILTHSQLAGRATDNPDIRRSLTVIEQAALDGSEVVKRIQNLARAKTPDVREPADLNVVLRQSLEIAQPAWMARPDSAEAPIAAHLDLGPAARITGAPSELREVFVNLMMNAVHAMPAGGTLTLRTYIKDGHWWGEVQDTGVGMTDEVKRKIFEPFFTTKGSAGSGLGLSIVASIVQRHNGIIEIDSALGRGTTIAVGFPMMTASAPHRESSSPRRVQMRDALQVLVVEDDPRSRDALTLALEQLGHGVTATGDLREALRLFLDGDFSVVFTDLSLGEKSGWEVAQAVKKMRSATEVILVTGWAAQLGVDDPSARGVDQVLAKPFTLEQIGAVLDQARQRRLAAQRTATA